MTYMNPEVLDQHGHIHDEVKSTIITPTYVIQTFPKHCKKCYIKIGRGLDNKLYYFDYTKDTKEDLDCETRINNKIIKEIIE